jgi:hypothetical protein
VTRLTVYRHFPDVNRVTPAASAMPAIVVEAGPTVVCSRAVASVIRCRVSSTSSARRCIRYGRDFTERARTPD